MKKNLISVLILALVLANLIMTGVLAFTIIPQTKKSNELIDKICNAIHLELESGESISVPIENIHVHNLVEEFTCNLKKGDDGKDHFALFRVGFSLNTQSEEYGKDGAGVEALTSKETIIRDRINSIVSQYTIDEFNAEGNYAVKQAILKEMQSLFGAEFIVGVSFSSVNAQ